MKSRNELSVHTTTNVDVATLFPIGETDDSADFKPASSSVEDIKTCSFRKEAFVSKDDGNRRPLNSMTSENHQMDSRVLSSIGND